MEYFVNAIVAVYGVGIGYWLKAAEDDDWFGQVLRQRHKVDVYFGLFLAVLLIAFWPVLYVTEKVWGGR